MRITELPSIPIGTYGRNNDLVREIVNFVSHFEVYGVGSEGLDVWAAIDPVVRAKLAAIPARSTSGLPSGLASASVDGSGNVTLVLSQNPSQYVTATLHNSSTNEQLGSVTLSGTQVVFPDAGVTPGMSLNLFLVTEAGDSALVGPFRVPLVA